MCRGSAAQQLLLLKPAWICAEAVPCAARVWRTYMLRNSNVSIWKPYAPSTKSKARSATFATSHIAFMSFGHSMIVSRRFLPVTTVTGPTTGPRFCFVQCLTSDWINVDLPTPGGPTTAMTKGGAVAASTERSTSETWYFFSCFSIARYAFSRIAVGPEAALNAFGLLRALPFPRRAALPAFSFFARAPRVAGFFSLAGMGAAATTADALSVRHARRSRAQLLGAGPDDPSAAVGHAHGMLWPLGDFAHDGAERDSSALAPRSAARCGQSNTLSASACSPQHRPTACRPHLMAVPSPRDMPPRQQ